MFATFQVALSLALLLGAGLMARSFLNVLHVDPGYTARNTLTMQLFLSSPGYFLWQAVSWLPEMGYNTGRRERGFRVMGRTRNGV